MPRKARTAALADTAAAPGGAAAVDRALSLLAAFQPGDAGLSLAELALRTQLYKSTALRLIASLEHAGLLQKAADGRYLLGAEVGRLHGIYAATFSPEQAVLPVLRQLVAATGESAAFHVRRGDARVCLYRVDSPHPVRDHLAPGELLPLTQGSGGRVLAAFDPGLLRAATPRDRRTLAQVREQGYCAAVGDRRAEVAGISAPVFHGDGRIAASLTLTMPAHRYDLRHVKPVLEAARRLNGKV
jgi:DNA-binding IclR family transcriptional regulator